MKFKKELNKWQCGINFEKSPYMMRGFYLLHIWFLKFLLLPSECEKVKKNKYKGFFLILKIKSPIYKDYNVQDGYVVRLPSVILKKVAE